MQFMWTVHRCVCARSGFEPMDIALSVSVIQKQTKDTKIIIENRKKTRRAVDKMWMSEVTRVETLSSEWKTFSRACVMCSCGLCRSIRSEKKKLQQTIRDETRSGVQCGCDVHITIARIANAANEKDSARKNWFRATCIVVYAHRTRCANIIIRSARMDLRQNKLFQMNLESAADYLYFFSHFSSLSSISHIIYCRCGRL